MLERKDVRLKLDADVHAGLDALAEVDRTGIADLAEEVIADYVRRRVHDASLIVEKLTRAGISGKAGERRGRG